MNDPTFSDITLMVSNRNNNNNNKEIQKYHSFHVHRAILAARSEVFKRAAHRNEVILEEVDPDGFSTLLKFLYTGEIIMTTGNIFDVISLADRFLVTGLSTPCSHLLRKLINVDNVFAFLQNLLVSAALDFNKEIIKFMINNFSSLWEKPEFTELPYDVILQLVKSDELHVVDEMHVLNAVLAWGSQESINADKSTKSVPKGQGKKKKIEDEESRDDHMKELLSYIRFCTLSTNQLNVIEKQQHMIKYSYIKDMLIEAWKVKARQPIETSVDPRRRSRRRRTVPRAMTVGYDEDDENYGRGYYYSSDDDV